MGSSSAPAVDDFAISDGVPTLRAFGERDVSTDTATPAYVPTRAQEGANEAGDLVCGSPSPSADTAAVRAAFPSLSLPRLVRFSGDKPDDDDGADQFVREFERHAKLAGWAGETLKLQFEIHLSAEPCVFMKRWRLRIELLTSQQGMPGQPG